MAIICISVVMAFTITWGPIEVNCLRLGSSHKASYLFYMYTEKVHRGDYEYQMGGHLNDASVSMALLIFATNFEPNHYMQAAALY